MDVLTKVRVLLVPLNHKTSTLIPEVYRRMIGR